LVYFTGGSWTLREFLDYIKYIPPGNRPNLAEPAQLKVDIALIIRDEFMANEGYKRGLETCQTVAYSLYNPDWIFPVYIVNHGID